MTASREHEPRGRGDVELAVRLYAEGLASLGQARRIAGLSKRDFLELLAERGVPRHYTRSELMDDVEYMQDG